MRSIDRRLAALESRIPAAPRRDFSRYQRDPAAYVREVLRQRLTPQQEAICGAAGRGDKIILASSANEVGKTWLAAALASWNFDAFRPSVTLTTAPTSTQVRDLLWNELRKLRPGDPAFLPKACYLGDGPDHYVRGYTARDATAFQGRHGLRLLVIFDEAEGIDGDFWEAAMSMADTLIGFYNPTTTSSQAAIEERRPGVTLYTLSALDHPNIIAQLRGDPAPFPAAVSLDKARTRLERWGTRLDAGEPVQPGDVQLGGVMYRPGPVAEARVLGRRPSLAVNSVFGELLWSRVSTCRHDIDDKWPAQIGCDVARFGDDFTEIFARRGPCVVHHEAHNGWSTTQTATRLRGLAREVAGSETPERVPVLIDDTGVGGGVTDQAQGFRFVGVNFGSKAVDALSYPDIRSQLYFDLADLAAARLLDVSRVNEETRESLRGQLVSIMYTLDAKGRRVVEPKKIYKQRFGRSPDTADALTLAYFQFPEVFEKV